MPIQYCVVDAFAGGPFTGNPAGVVLLHEGRSDQWMLNVAREISVSDTAFIDVRELDTQLPAADSVPLRWFTPDAEVDLCGHATIAAAHVISDFGIRAATFTTKGGDLMCEMSADGRISADFPSDAPTTSSIDVSLAFPEVTPLGVYAGKSDVLVELANAQEVEALHPVSAEVTALPCRGVIVTARADGDADYVARCFYPGTDVPEDFGDGICSLHIRKLLVSAIRSVKADRLAVVGTWRCHRTRNKRGTSSTSRRSGDRADRTDSGERALSSDCLK